jgi:hypothetical protein
MTEKGETVETQVIVEEWIGAISTEGKVGEINPSLLREALEGSGANFEPTPELVALASYTNKAKRPGLNSVWGEERVEEYKSWAKAYVEEYEAKSGKPLPELKPSGSKTSGMIQFFGELTAFASGKTNFSDYKTYTEARALNGRLWQEGKKDERVRVKVPTSKSPILLSSFPPGFPVAAWEKIKSWKR